MNKVIILSLPPEQVKNILNGIQTRVLTRKIPKDFVGYVYIHVKKDPPYIEKAVYEGGSSYYEEIRNIPDWNVNGRVVSGFWFSCFDEIKQSTNVYNDWLDEITVYENCHEWLLPKEEELYVSKLCMSEEEVLDYIKNTKFTKDNINRYVWAWHIKDLDIFDEPLKLSRFYKDFGLIDKYSEDSWLREIAYEVIPLKRAPSSWRYAYIESDWPKDLIIGIDMALEVEPKSEAEELFEELGCKKIVDNDEKIMFSIMHENGYFTSVVFYKNSRSYRVYRTNGIDIHVEEFIFPKLHKAIHNQLEELRWLDD